MRPHTQPDIAELTAAQPSSRGHVPSSFGRDIHRREERVIYRSKSHATADRQPEPRHKRPIEARPITRKEM